MNNGEDFTLEEILDSTVFSEYAGLNKSIWQQLQDTSVINNVYKEGKIRKVEIDSNHRVNLYIDFNNLPEEDNPKCFYSTSVKNGFLIFKDVEKIIGKWKVENRNQYQDLMNWVEKLLIEREKKREIERQEQLRLEQVEGENLDKENFAKLKTKYLVSNFSDTSPTSLLYAILIKIESEELLTGDDEKWLIRHRLFAVLGSYFEIKSHLPQSESWDSVTAGKYWRKAKQPQRAIDALKGANSNNERIKSAILTVRGAALKDKKQFQEATQEAKKAIAVSPRSYHPYNLMGAICVQNGAPEEGNAYFEKAKELGASPEEMDEIIKDSIQNADAENQLKAIRYLLAKDPVKYKWAKFYLPKKKEEK